MERSLGVPDSAAGGAAVRRPCLLSRGRLPEFPEAGDRQRGLRPQLEPTGSEGELHPLPCHPGPQPALQRLHRRQAPAAACSRVRPRHHPQLHGLSLWSGRDSNRPHPGNPERSDGHWLGPQPHGGPHLCRVDPRNLAARRLCHHRQPSSGHYGAAAWSALRQYAGRTQRLRHLRLLSA